MMGLIGEIGLWPQQEVQGHLKIPALVDPTLSVPLKLSQTLPSIQSRLWNDFFDFKHFWGVTRTILAIASRLRFHSENLKVIILPNEDITMYTF